MFALPPDAVSAANPLARGGASVGASMQTASSPHFPTASVTINLTGVLWFLLGGGLGLAGGYYLSKRAQRAERG